MRITKGQLKQIIREEANRLHESEIYVRDGIATDDEGNTYRTSMPDGLYKASQMRGGYGSYRDDRYPPRKTQYVGASALQPMIAAVQAALATKPNSFLQSVLGQMEAGRMPSAKQKSIVKRIIKKHDPTSAQLFESAGAMPLVGLTALGNGPMSARPTGQSLNEGAYLHDILYDAAVALNRRDVDTLERLLSEFDGMLIGDAEARGYTMALQAMIDAAYELEDSESSY